MRGGRERERLRCDVGLFVKFAKPMKLIKLNVTIEQAK